MQEILNSGDSAVIDAERKYWLVRTMGGDYYSDYVTNGFIAIGYDEITAKDLNELPDNINLAKESLISKFEKAGTPKNRSSYAVSQLLRFQKEISIGDVIVVPSRSSHHASFGLVESNTYESPRDYSNPEGCYFTKRRKVNWKLAKLRWHLNPNLQLMFNSRHIISNVDKYAPYIDSLMNGFYLKEDEAFLTLRINAESDISTNHFSAIFQLLKYVDNFCEQNKIDSDPNDIILKVQMESPGDIRLNSKRLSKIALLAISVIFFNGGGLKIENDSFNLDLSSDGLIKNFSDYLDRSADRETKMSIKNALDSLKLEAPQDMDIAIKLLQEQNSIRNNY